MNLAAWLAQNWFTLLQSLGITASLLFTAYSFRLDAKIRRVDNLFVISANHREVWTRFSERPGLHRVLDDRADMRQQPISREEEIFINSVLFHLNGVFYAQKAGLAFNMEGLRRDVRWFISLPIPRAVWETTRTLQNVDFVAFVESCFL